MISESRYPRQKEREALTGDPKHSHSVHALGLNVGHAIAHYARARVPQRYPKHALGDGFELLGPALLSNFAIELFWVDLERHALCFNPGLGALGGIWVLLWELILRTQLEGSEKNFNSVQIKH
jgi:hypothetical protein